MGTTPINDYADKAVREIIDDYKVSMETQLSDSKTVAILLSYKNELDRLKKEIEFLREQIVNTLFLGQITK